METKILNLTPHPITICDKDGVVIRTILSSGLVRLKAVTVPAGTLDGVSVTKTEFGQAEGLPDFQEGTYYIVSQLVKTALPGRNDLLVPAEVLRDTAGQIIGCKSLGI
jgi:ABC-type arginine transport system permease subunit